MTHITYTSIIKSLFVSLFLFFAFPVPAFSAFSYNIIDINPSSVTSKDQEVTVNVSITELPSESYFRAEWQQSPGSAYFGYSKNNNGDWTKVGSSQNCVDYYKISDTATTSAVLITKIGNDNDPASGTYTIRVRRYTSSCASSSDSDPSPVTISLPSSAPTPNPTSTPATSTPSPTKTPTPSPTKSPTPKPTAKASKSPEGTPSDFESEVLSAREELLASDSPSPTPSPKKFSFQNIFPVVLILFGIGLLGIGGYPFIKAQIKKYNERNEKLS